MEDIDPITERREIYGETTNSSASVENQGLDITCPHCNQSFFVDIYLTNSRVAMMTKFKDKETMEKRKETYAHV